MEAWIEWGYEVIRALQAARSPFLDAIATAFTRLGDEEFYLLLIPLLYWLVNKRWATRFSVLLLLSVYVNTWAKALVDQPRPSPTRVAVLDDPTGGGLPSGHAQNAAAAWGLVAHDTAHRWVRAAIALLVVAIGVSRLYLGVHFPHDVVVGWLMGALLLVGFVVVSPRAEAWLAQQSLTMQMLIPAALCLVLALLVPVHEAITAVGTLLGMALAVPLERRYVRFAERGMSAPRLLLRALLGIAVALLIWRGLKPVLLPLGELGSLLRYALLGLWVGVAGPALFVRLGLANVETNGSGERRAESAERRTQSTERRAQSAERRAQEQEM